jgi:Xaa-Pro aminopeptidase
MLVVCARDQGLYACLTRFVRFTAPDTEQLRREQHIREIEAAALTASRPGVTLDVIYRAIKAAYEARGYADAIRQHHQGGITGYRVREVIATPSTTQVLGEGMALAWNPSLTGTKIEDTFVIGEDGRLQNLTFDPAWPNTEVEGRPRPLPLVIT